MLTSTASGTRQGLGLWIGATQVYRLEPTEFGAELGQVMLIENASTDKNFAQVGSRSVGRRGRVLELLSSDDLALEQKVLEVPVGGEIEMCPCVPPFVVVGDWT